MSEVAAREDLEQIGPLQPLPFDASGRLRELAGLIGD